MTYKSTGNTKYLSRFLDPPISGHSYPDLPTKPTEPPQGGSKGTEFRDNPTGDTQQNLRNPDLSVRWGPALEDEEPSIVIPAGDWRHKVAGLPHAEWIRWRRRSDAIQATFATATGLPLELTEILEADQMAAEEVLTRGNRLPTQTSGGNSGNSGNSFSRPASSRALRYVAAFLSQGSAARSRVVAKAAESDIPEAEIEAAADALGVERSGSEGAEMWKIT